MQNIVDRGYVRQHPHEVIKTFGLVSYLQALGSRRKGLLEQMTEKYLSGGIPMPGRVGNAYKLSALIEFRVARIYGRLAEKFRANQRVHDFFRELQAEEEEHGRLMLLCLYTVEIDPDMEFVPSILDPEIRALLRDLRSHERNADHLSLDEALDLTEQLELSEVNVIFDRLLRQTKNPQSNFFISQLAKTEGHSAAVPKRIKALRQQLGSSA